MKYEIAVEVREDIQFGYAEFWYPTPDNASCPYTIKVFSDPYRLSDSNGSGPEGFTTWEAAKTAFLEAVAQQMLSGSARKVEAG